MTETGSDSSLPAEVLAHYETGYEARRLTTGMARLEFARTQDILQRYLPPPPAVVFDVGGGPGTYACWLAKKGYEVHLVDPVPLHVEQARIASMAQPDHPIASVALGDARGVNRPGGSVDVALLLGPLYHLTDRSDRLIALRETGRVLKPGGLLFGATISRFTSTLDGLRRGLFNDPYFVEIVKQDLIDGQHRNPTNHPFYFTTAFFHHPEELRSEIEEAGLEYQVTLSVEGPAWLLENFEEYWWDPKRRELLLDTIRAIESDGSILGVSVHMMIVARKGS